MFAVTGNDDIINLTIKGTQHELTQDDLNQLVTMLIPHVTPKERYIFSLFQRLSPTEREQIGTLLHP